MKSFSLGKIFGIEVGLHWSVLLLAYIGFAMASGNITSALKLANHPQTLYITLALNISSILVAVLFVASVLAHEFAHALVGRRLGVGFKGITLFALGGIAQMTESPPTAKVEFLMAGAGPLYSIVSGVVFFLAGILLAYLPFVTMKFAATSFLLLGIVNVWLGLFNLIPMWPTDGGRLLRSGLWALTKNQKVSTYIAGYIGMAFAAMFVVTGIAMSVGISIPVFGVGISSGLWMALIGALIFFMARSEVLRIGKL